MPNSSDFNRFAVNPVNIDISRSMFNMDHSVKFSCNVGDVIPFDVTEVLPGDTFEVDTTKVVRLQPLVAPIMDEVIMDVYHFFVPNRLVWNEWKEFMGENTSSAWAPTSTPVFPTITVPSGGFDVGTIADYMGIPSGRGAGTKVSALPFRAYALICDQWFRSEAVMDPVHCHVDSVNRTGVNTGDQVTDIELGGKPFIACKFFDYFTACLPSPQRGDPVSLPVLDNNIIVPVFGADKTKLANYYEVDPTRIWNPAVSGLNITDFEKPIHFNVGSNGVHINPPDSDVKLHVGINNSGNNGDANLYSNSGSVTTSDPIYIDNLYGVINDYNFHSVTINDLRTAFAVQKYLEKSARYGGRYIEHIKAFFNVDSPDYRLQRSEYLGGSRLSLNINQVENQTLDSNAPLGHVGGMSVTADSHSDFTKSFTEDGLLISCAVLRYHHTYSQGLDRMWTRRSVYDYYNPVFANLGEQAVYQQELYMLPNNAHGNVFGYQERWAEYRYKPNRVAGEMRPGVTNSLSMWHLADYYNQTPTLSPSWLREDKSMLDRCLAVTSANANQCICDFFIQMKASRPMPLYSIPGLIDHH